MPAPTVGRITTRAAFAQLQRTGRRGSSGPIRAVFLPAEIDREGVFPQVGYAVGKRCGNAVSRNRLRRRLREATRAAALAEGGLARGYYLLRAEPAAVGRETEALAGDVSRALQRAAGGAR